jgi:ArsR family transcriptional regulator, virulence genes transcriptional regulator
MCRDSGPAAPELTQQDLRICASREKLEEMISSIPATDALRSRAATIAKALSDPKRLCVVEQLSGGERSVGDLSRCIGCQVPNMSQHLAVLRTAGIVERRREGGSVLYRLTNPSVLDAYRLLQQIAR